ncbi:MAG TPA: GGDEF domain-containing protein [Sphingobium sp.]|nr:GGDEF domain-containing protein [Sphingobium sp.]
MQLQNIILDMVARGEELKDTADRLCREVEVLLPDVVCSILTLDRANTLRALSAPSLPETYSRAIDGLQAGPDSGSCGSAAYWRKPVAVTDIAQDPRWILFRDLVLPLGFRACWSSPICDARGDVLGTFAFYYRDNRGPTQVEIDIVGACVHLCVIALERHDRVLERDRLANADGLTGLANRACFNAALAALDCNEPGTWALLALDLDNLKVVNDTFGHHAGDILLKCVGARLVEACAPDRAYRLGGDEFAVIVQAHDALRDLDGAADKILERLAESVEGLGHILFPRATIGGAVLAPTDHVAESVRQNADFALYHAKETGRGGFVRYWPGIGTSITQRLSVIQEVGAALRDGRIDAYYQPIFRLDTREIVGVEALCRMITRDGRVQSAAQFIEATSDAHIACAITDAMLARVAADVRRWLNMGIPFQHVGINVSSADFHRGRLSERFSEAFDAEEVPLNHLIVEVTEGVYLDQRDNVIAREIATMRGHGLKVALDDFGTGFASLTHLLTVPTDIIKIDRSFIARLAPGDPSAAIVKGLFFIASELGIRVVAEGIETEEQAAQLTEFGCTLGQGYLYSRAVDRETMTSMLTQNAQFPDFETLPINVEARKRTGALE